MELVRNTKFTRPDVLTDRFRFYTYRGRYLRNLKGAWRPSALLIKKERICNE